MTILGFSSIRCGAQVAEQLAQKMALEGMKGFGARYLRNLWWMRDFYRAFYGHEVIKRAVRLRSLEDGFDVERIHCLSAGPRERELHPASRGQALHRQHQDPAEHRRDGVFGNAPPWGIA